MMSAIQVHLTKGKVYYDIIPPIITAGLQKEELQNYV
jgi:hypothetical protein